jgi:hypothetical protein
METTIDNPFERLGRKGREAIAVGGVLYLGGLEFFLMESVRACLHTGSLADRLKINCSYSAKSLRMCKLGLQSTKGESMGCIGGRIFWKRC